MAKDRELRDRLTRILQNAYCKDGGVCKVHQIFQPQKAINVILSVIEQEREKVWAELVKEIERHEEKGGFKELLFFCVNRNWWNQFRNGGATNVSQQAALHSDQH